MQLIGNYLEKHPPVYIRSHSWHVRANTKTWMRLKELSVELRDRIESRKRYFFSAALRSPRTQLPPSFLNGRHLEPLKLFWELSARPNWIIKGEGHWSGRWPRTRWLLWQSSRVPLWWWENLPEGQPSLQHSTNQALKVEWPNGSHSSVKGKCQPAWSLPKGT